MSIGRGEFVSIVGSSGAGKSTLIRLLIAEERPSRGTITVAGRDITRLRPDELPYFRRNVGVVFQDFKLLAAKSVSENIAFALEVCDAPSAEIVTRVTRILDLVGLSDRATLYPDELSGGERQRAAIARALVHSPKILIADEPTGNLDPENTWEVIELLERINRAGTIVLLATHNKAVVDKLRRRVIVLDRGHLVADEAVSGYVIHHREAAS
jgi:cell division transport system ATP-binding protein